MSNVNGNQTTARSGQQPGQVKLNTGNGLKPTHTFTVGDVGDFIQATYVTPLGLSSSPTTTWPSNIVTPAESDIYDFVNDTFLENTVPGQNHVWRVIVTYSGKSAGTTTGCEVKIENTLSGFTISDVKGAPKDTTSGTLVFILDTIADSASLPSPFGTGQGYEISYTARDPLTFTIDSVTRISNAHATRN